MLLGVAVHRDATFGRAVRVDHLDAEAARERVDDLGRSFVAERDPQRVVGVVGPLGLREQVRERLAGVVEVGRAVAADVGQPARRARTAGPSPTLAPTTIDGAHPTCTAFEWKSGMHT